MKGGLGEPLTRKEAEAIIMHAGMTRADIRRSVRMAHLPKELHETILAEVMQRKRLAENVAINAVWRAFQRLERAAFGWNCHCEEPSDEAIQRT